MGLSLSNQAHCNGLDATVNLLTSYILCIKPVTLEADVDTEITRMTMKGITEPYDDPKGFISPVFTFYKNNGKICVFTNFKRTVKKLFAYLDLYQQSTKYSRKLAKAKKYFLSLNLCNCYWQIVSDEYDDDETTFIRRFDANKTLI